MPGAQKSAPEVGRTTAFVCVYTFWATANVRLAADHEV
jgi:hypothetical protein